MHLVCRSGTYGKDGDTADSGNRIADGNNCHDVIIGMDIISEKRKGRQLMQLSGPSCVQPRRTMCRKPFVKAR